MIKRFRRKPQRIHGNWILFSTAMAALFLLAPLAGFADDEQSDPAEARNVPDFSAFQILIDRNIFSPARQAPVPEAERAATAPPPPEFRGRTLRLMGTVVRNDLRVALFEGGDAPAGGVKPGETVAGYTVAGIRTRGVTLDGAGETVELSVGAGLKEQEDGRWSVVDASAVAVSRPPEPSPGEESKGGEEASETSNENDAGGSNDLLERLRERRRRGLGQ